MKTMLHVYQYVKKEFNCSNTRYNFVVSKYTHRIMNWLFKKIMYQLLPKVIYKNWQHLVLITFMTIVYKTSKPLIDGPGFKLNSI